MSGAVDPAKLASKQRAQAEAKLETDRNEVIVKALGYLARCTSTGALVVQVAAASGELDEALARYVQTFNRLDAIEADRRRWPQ